jgi:hypothetical protein
MFEPPLKTKEELAWVTGLFIHLGVALTRSMYKGLCSTRDVPAGAVWWEKRTTDRGIGLRVIAAA